MERFNIVSIIPALNEENSIIKIINQVSKYSDVIVINDGSEDNTSYLANKCGATGIDHSKNLGYDASINSGFKKAKASVSPSSHCDAVWSAAFPFEVEKTSA